MDTRAYHKNISAFKESFNSGNKDLLPLLSLEVGTDEGSFPSFQEVAHYSCSEVWNTTLNIWFRKIPEGKMFHNWFSFRMIQIILSLFKETTERGCIFSADEVFHNYMPFILGFKAFR